MNMKSFFKGTKLLCSIEAETGAERLLEKIRNRSLGMDILPNRYPRFSGELEEEDYVSYCRFLESSNGKKVLEMLEEDDARNYVEL